MPIKIGWAVEKRVVFIQMRDVITSEDVLAWDKRAVVLLDELHQESIFVLVDQTQLKGLRGFNQLVTMAALRHPKIREIDLYAIYGVHDKLLIQANRLMVQLSGIPTQFFDTEEAARQAIQALDPTLPDLKPYLNG